MRNKGNRPKSALSRAELRAWDIMAERAKMGRQICFEIALSIAHTQLAKSRYYGVPLPKINK